MTEILVWRHGGFYDFEYVIEYMVPVLASEKLVRIELEMLDQLEDYRSKFGWDSIGMQVMLGALYNG